jgi:TPR repeat protein
MSKPRRASVRPPRKARAPKAARLEEAPQAETTPAPPEAEKKAAKPRKTSKRRRAEKVAKIEAQSPPVSPDPAEQLDQPSSELDDELKAAKQILDSISWTKLATAGRTVEPSRPVIKAERVHQHEAAATSLAEGEASAEIETVFDPFLDSDFAEEPPFDAPSDQELEQAIAIEPEVEPESFATPTSAPALQPIRAIRTYAATASSNPAYLENARRAVQEQTRIDEERPWFARVRDEGRLVASIAIGLAAPLLLFAAANALRGPTQQADAPIIGSVARAAEPTSARADESATYAIALQRIGEGRMNEGEALLRRAAENGHVPAQYRLAKLYERGEAGERDLASARRWTERAALGGNCRAMHDLGVFFARGEGAPVDDAAAFRWFRQAAELGVADSQFNLGVLYAQGRGVGANAEEALFWFLVASRQHDVDAVDRAVDLAAQLESAQVARARARARAFTAQSSSGAANTRDCAQSA